MKAEFTTARGAKIEISLITERTNIADHNVVSPCLDLEYRVNGNLSIGRRVDDPQHGPCIDLCGKVAPIPADDLTAVDAVITAYTDALRARNAAADAEDRRFASSRRLARDMDRADSNN